MPSSSIRLTSEASEKRGGGSVKCWVTASASRFSASPSLDRRQPARILVVGIVVAAFLIDREEAVELHHLAGGAQFQRAAAGLGLDVDGGALELGRFHLAGDGAHPDQLVEPGLVGIEPRAQSGGRRDRSVGRIASCASWAFLALACSAAARRAHSAVP